jgi:hypothetical protein
MFPGATPQTLIEPWLQQGPLNRRGRRFQLLNVRKSCDESINYR